MTEPPKLKELADLAYYFACKVKLGKNEELLPMFLIERDGKREVVGVPYDNLDQKRTMVVNVALEIAERGASAWSFLSDTWFVRRAQDELRGPPPSEDPKRKEGVWCLTSDGKETLIYTWEIFRDEKGNCTALVAQDGSPHRANSWISVALNKAMKLHEDFPQPSKEPKEFPI